MILKRLEIYGFKSFGKKVEIDFKDNITCIVGPNGSGKSNIADAFRWVMGEQRVKSLRGSRMDDVIFSGTNEKKALGYAQVTLTLDNSAKMFDADYDEISVTRRLFRSGESEYYINKTICRLKDIQALFMDTGLGREGYSLIGQGQIETLVTDSPLERKLLIEEAAGVVKYKVKKTEAERRLERAQNNLYRITDIIAELETRVPVLKRQAEKAEKYVELRNELKEIEVGIFVHRMDMLNAAASKLYGDRDALNESIKNNDTEIEALDEKYRFLKATVGTFDERINKANNAIYDLSSEFENSKISIEVAKAKIADYEEDLKSIADEHSGYENEIADLERKRGELSEELNNCKQELSVISGAYDKYKENVEDILSKLRTDESRLSVLEGYENSMQGYQLAIRQLMTLKKTSPDAFKGLYTTVGELIKAPDKYAKAITVALGASASNMVCDNESVASLCIEKLKENKWGRVTFLPVNIIKPAFPKEEASVAKNCPGFISFAAELVSCDGRFSNIIKNLLGRVIVCDTLANANVIAKKISYSSRIVTLAGEVLFPGGAVSGGSYKNEDEGSIVRRNQIDKLKAAIKENKNRYEKLMSEGTRDGDSQIIRLRGEVIRCGENLKNTEEKIAYFNNLRRSKREQNNRTLEELESLKKSVSDYSDTDEDFLRKKKELETLYLNLIEEKKSANEEYSHISEKISELHKERTETGEHLSKIEVAIGRTELEIEHLQNDMMEDYSLTYAAAVPFKTDIDDMEKSMAQVSAIKEKIRRLGNINVDSLEEYKQVKERFESMCAQRDDLNQSKEDLIKIITDISSGMEKKFTEQFNVIQKEFDDVFKILFSGGEANLVLTDPEDVMNSGVDIIARPPNTKLKNITALSGGEKSLTAIALIFAILRIKPTPFCILDEIDAALDEANVGRFSDFLKTVSDINQFIVVTHKKRTMEIADSLYGVSMGLDGVTQVLSVKLSDIEIDEKGEYDER